MLRRNVVLGACALIILVTACVSGPMSGQHPATVGTGRDWPQVGGSTDESSFSQLNTINTGNTDRRIKPIPKMARAHCWPGTRSRVIVTPA